MSDFPERVLWQGVVMQAVADALSTTARDEKRKRDSVKWFNLKNPDFLLICDYAGYCPRWLVNGINRKKDVVSRRVNRKMNRKVLKQARA